MSIRSAIVRRFAPPEWACFFEVRNATGYGSVTRYADALAMNLYPSRGLEIHGVEIKTNRSDWLRELADPDKSAPVQAHCDRWWVAIDDPKIVQAGELPSTWGLLVLHGSKLVQRVAAPALAAPPLTREFIASLLRSATANMVPKSEVRALAREMAEELARTNRDSNATMVPMLERSLAELQKSVADFEEKSGVRINAYDGARLGSAVRRVLMHTPLANELEREETVLRRHLEAIVTARAELSAAAKDGD